MRAVFALFLWLAAIVPSFAEDVIHFVAFAGIKSGKEAQYDAFIEAVLPIWKRHGMTVVARARPMEPSQDHRGPLDLTVLRVESRTSFNAYIADEQYQALRPLRLDALDTLAIFDGIASLGDERNLQPTAGLSLYFFETDGETSVENFRILEDGTKENLPTAARMTLRIKTVGEVKGALGYGIGATRTIVIEASDQTHRLIPPNTIADNLPFKMHVLTGPRLY